MGRLTNSKKIKLLRIEKARLLLSKQLHFLITEEDILSLINVDINYGVRTGSEKVSYKNQVLKDIFNCPFLLFDQKVLTKNVKELIPCLVDVKYSIEKEMIDSYYNNGYLDEEEYKKELDELEFCFYKTSNEGKKILELRKQNNKIVR